MGLFDRFKTKQVVVPESKAVPKGPTQLYRSTFMAAAANRLQNSWFKPLQSSNRELVNELATVRGLARYLAKNDVYTARYLELCQTNISGPSGIALIPRVMGPDDEFNQPVNQELRRGWTEWMQTASVDGDMSFHELEQLVIRTIAMDGEVFIRMVTGPKVNKFGFGLLLVDADLLDTQFNGTAKNGHSIVQGVELNRYGMVEAYHFWTRHPQDTNQTAQPLERQRIPADEIIHLFKRSRVGQVRGYSWVAPAMYFLAKLHEYMDAEVVAAQAGASQIATIETPANDASGYNTEGNTQFGQEVINLEPGVVLRLAPGEKLSPWNSGHPNNAFDPFVKTLLHGIASALNVSYSSLASDASEENYASGRLGVITERDYWKNQQSWLINRFHRKVYNAWVQYALAFDALNLPHQADEYADVEFRARGWKWADPLRDMKGVEGAINANLMSKSQVCAESGLDYKEVLEQRYEEIKLEAQFRKYLDEEGLGEYVNQLTVPSPAIAEAKPTVEAALLAEDEPQQETVTDE